MNESLKDRALTLIHMESNPSKEEWIELVRELLELSPLEEFGVAVLQQARGELGDVDGGWIQDKAESLGLLKFVTVAEPCNPEMCRCAEYYDNDEWPVQCLRYSPEISLLIDGITLPDAPADVNTEAVTEYDEAVSK